MYIVTKGPIVQAFSCAECVDGAPDVFCDCVYNARACSKALGVNTTITRNGRVLGHNTTVYREVSESDAKNDAADGVIRSRRRPGSRTESYRRGVARSARARRAAA